MSVSGRNYSTPMALTSYSPMAFRMYLEEVRVFTADFTPVAKRWGIYMPINFVQACFDGRCGRTSRSCRHTSRLRQRYGSGVRSNEPCDVSGYHGFIGEHIIINIPMTPEQSNGD